MPALGPQAYAVAVREQALPGDGSRLVFATGDPERGRQYAEGRLSARRDAAIVA